MITVIDATGTAPVVINPGQPVIDSARAVALATAQAVGSAATASTAAGTATAQAAAAGLSAASADASAAQASASATAVPLFPILNASTVMGGSNVLPQGITSGTVGGTAVTGATPGTYALTATGGSFTGVTANLVVTSATVATIQIVTPGRTTSASPTAPTWANPSGANLPSGTTLTAVIGNLIGAGTGQYYATPTADGTRLLYWQNTGTGVPVAVVDPNSAQIAYPLAPYFVANADSGAVGIPGDAYAAGVYNKALKKAVPFMSAVGRLVSWAQGVVGAAIERVATISDVTSLGTDIMPASSTLGGRYAFGVFNAAAKLFAPMLHEDGYLVSKGAATGLVERVTTSGDLAAFNAPTEGVSAFGGTSLYALAVYNSVTKKAMPILDAAGHVVSRNNLTGGIEPVATMSDVLAFTPGARQRYTGETYSTGRMSLLDYSSTPSTTWVVYILCGQSNAQGQNTNTRDAIIAASQPYPSNVWMLSGGPIQSGAGSTTMVPAVESVHGGQRETSASSFGVHLYGILNSTLAVTPNILVAVTALGSMPYLRLKRGNPTYTDFLQCLDNIATAIAAKGGTKIIPIIKWRGGEGDCDSVPGMSRTRYERQLMQFEADVREDVYARLGTYPTLMVDQVSFTPAGYDTWEEPVRMAAVAVDGKGCRIRARGAWYQMPMDTSTTTVIHASCAGQNRVGHLDAIAAANELFGSGHVPFKAARWWHASPTQVRIEYVCNPALTGTTAPSLVLDTTDTYVTTSTLVTQGFRCRDSNGSIAINSITVSGMILTINHAAYTGTRFQVAYATERDAGNTTTDGNISGARGALRNNVGYANYWSGVTEYDWAMAQIMDF